MDGYITEEEIDRIASAPIDGPDGIDSAWVVIHRHGANADECMRIGCNPKGVMDAVVSYLNSLPVEVISQLGRQGITPGGTEGEALVGEVVKHYLENLVTSDDAYKNIPSWEWGRRK